MYRTLILSLCIAAICSLAYGETLSLGSIDVAAISDIRITSLAMKTRFSIAISGTSPSLSVSLAMDTIPSPAPTLNSIVKRNGTDFILADLQGNTVASVPGSSNPTSSASFLRSSTMGILVAGVLGLLSSLKRSSALFAGVALLLIASSISSSVEAQRGVPELQVTLNLPSNYSINSLTVRIADGSFSSALIGAEQLYNVRGANIHICGKTSNPVYIS
eukprot:TRINITY_DN2895_c0_g1_i1.p1 TRINITY_DN2895_c0_g1~~TRINITY_DN2895_c0_g1_i1.p1  ORF type:complete len:218 (-),score=38.73 TRINITY_DN2895_c0_g1_i1:126-779(-)